MAKLKTVYQVSGQIHISHLGDNTSNQTNWPVCNLSSEASNYT